MSSSREDPPHDELIKRIRETIQRARPQGVSDKPDSKFAAETQDLEQARLLTQVHGLRQDIAERKKYAHRAFWMVVFWLVVIAVIMFFQGFRTYGFFMEPEVLMALIGGTTTGIIGIFLIVARYLFPRP